MDTAEATRRCSHRGHGLVHGPIRAPATLASRRHCRSPAGASSRAHASRHPRLADGRLCSPSTRSPRPPHWPSPAPACTRAWPRPTAARATSRSLAQPRARPCRAVRRGCCRSSPTLLCCSAMLRAAVTTVASPPACPHASAPADVAATPCLPVCAAGRRRSDQPARRPAPHVARSRPPPPRAVPLQFAGPAACLRLASSCPLRLLARTSPRSPSLLETARGDPAGHRGHLRQPPAPVPPLRRFPWPASCAPTAVPMASPEPALGLAPRRHISARSPPPPKPARARGKPSRPASPARASSAPPAALAVPRRRGSPAARRPTPDAAAPVAARRRLLSPAPRPSTAVLRAFFLLRRRPPPLSSGLLQLRPSASPSLSPDRI
nr:vegetative cell wall protein gp1-like [Aegilops tauschii subsp. strangulata]